MQGTVNITMAGPLTIHTYTAPEQGWRANSNVVELADQVVLVDAPLIQAHAQEVAQLIAATGKPLTRLYLSHAHPDHYVGAAFFNAPTYALAGTKATIEAAGATMAAGAYQLSGAGEPPAGRAIDHVIEPGTETISGIEFRFDAITDAEAADQLTIGFPEQNVLIAGDILYQDVHMFLGQQEFDGWKAAIAKLENTSCTTIIPGHGEPGGRDIFDHSRQYLDAAVTAVAQAGTAEELDRALTTAFPAHGGHTMIALQNLFLFPQS